MILHGHCHHKAIESIDDEEALLRSARGGLETLDSGCCGLAGSFGYEAGEKYDVSMRAGERVLLPAVRDAPNALVITDGFSCRSQIEHGADRRAHHLAEVAAMALRQETVVPRQDGDGRRRVGQTETREVATQATKGAGHG